MLKIIDTNGYKDLKYFGHTVPRNTVIYNLTGDILKYPSKTSIQINDNQHIEDELGKFINHSCNPTVKISGTKIISVKTINYNDSITFNYNTNETVVSHPFRCNCCGNWILGKNN